MSSVKSSASLFRSSIVEDQDVAINCPLHFKSAVFSICNLEKCEYGHFICPKCSLERPEHMIAHKPHLELVKDFVNRSLSSETLRDPDFKKWEQDVERKITDILITSDSFEKTFEEILGRKVSLLQERITKHLATLQESLKTLISFQEVAAVQEIKKKINTLKTRVNVEKILNIVDKARSYESNRNRKEILDSVDLVSAEMTDISNLTTKIGPIENLVSAIITQFNSIFYRLTASLRPQVNSLSDIFAEISRQNTVLEAEMKRSHLKQSTQSVTLSNYSSNSTQQRSQGGDMKESSDKNITYLNHTDKSSPQFFNKQKEEIKLSNPDLKTKSTVLHQHHHNQVMMESGEMKKSHNREAGHLLLFKACEEKINSLNPFFLKSTITYEEIKSFIENFIKTQMRESQTGTTYFGELRDGKKEGYGIDIRNDFIYLGEYKDDLPNGKGKMIFKNADYYDGDWKDGKFEGQGRFVLRATGISYHGQFVQGLKDGYGIEERADGSKYEGHFKEGQKHGKGLYKWAIGERYEGEFVENKMYGNGTYSWNDGTVYVGEWKDNKLYGNGLLIEGNGGRYLGSFKNDKKEGYGVYTWNDGWIYRGNWRNGVQNGIGTEVDPKGTSRVCQWKDGTVIKYLA